MEDERMLKNYKKMINIFRDVPPEQIRFYYNNYSIYQTPMEWNSILESRLEPIFSVGLECKIDNLLVSINSEKIFINKEVTSDLKRYILEQKSSKTLDKGLRTIEEQQIISLNPGSAGYDKIKNAFQIKYYEVHICMLLQFLQENQARNRFGIKPKELCKCYVEFR
ncbi:TPA: hypothetical protein HA235_00585 [Candidatus Woesearchaeota archaeon]|nr:hypothetical protein [Candidatus Woesearchaeota archaeon]HIH55552.1 hypothetical protein [Candidatus Woesearchaeota archaeon]